MVRAVLEEAWSLTKARWMTAWAVLSLMTILGVTLIVLSKWLLAEDPLDAGRVLGIVVTTPLRVGSFLVFARLARGDRNTGDPVRRAFIRIIPLALLAILTEGVFLLSTMAIPGLGPYLGTVALLVVLPILMTGLWFADFLVVDRNMNAIEALVSSWTMMRCHKLELFKLLVTGLCILIASILTVLGWLAAVPLILFAQGVFYNRVLTKLD